MNMGNEFSSNTWDMNFLPIQYITKHTDLAKVITIFIYREMTFQSLTTSNKHIYLRKIRENYTNNNKVTKQTPQHTREAKSYIFTSRGPRGRFLRAS